MDTEEVVGSLSADEKAYFDTRGEAEIKDTPAPQVSEEPKPEPEAVEVDVDAELADADVSDDTEAPEKPTGQSKVPLAALTKERAKAKAEAERRIEAEKKAAILEDRWNMVLASQQQQQEQPAPVEQIPDPALDPLGALNWATQQLKDAREKQAAEAQKTEAERRADAEWQQTYRAVNDDYTASVAAEPTIKSAHEYLLNSQGEEFMAMGMSREEAQQEISRIEAQHIAFAARSGKKIGPYIMGLAKARGFKAEAPKPADPAADMDKLSEAVEGSTSLSDGGGAAPAAVNSTAIANMSPEQFEAWLSKPGNQAKFKRLAGG